MIRVFLVLLTSLTVFSCDENPETYIEHIEGYWEISSVSKNGKAVKSFTVNTSIDYFKVNDDLSGFRKKLSPSLDGSFSASQHESPFILKVENNELQIHYTVNNLTFIETIKEASEDVLILINDEGFKYSYKPFKSLYLTE